MLMNDVRQSSRAANKRYSILSFPDKSRYSDFILYLVSSINILLFLKPWTIAEDLFFR